MRQLDHFRVAIVLLTQKFIPYHADRLPCSKLVCNIKVQYLCHTSYRPEPKQKIRLKCAMPTKNKVGYTQLQLFSSMQHSSDLFVGCSRQDGSYKCFNPRFKNFSLTIQTFFFFFFSPTLKAQIEQITHLMVKKNSGMNSGTPPLNNNNNIIIAYICPSLYS